MKGGASKDKDAPPFSLKHLNANMMIDQQLGGEWVGPVEMEDLPVEMEIDWVRFYQKK